MIDMSGVFSTESKCLNARSLARIQNEPEWLARVRLVDSVVKRRVVLIGVESQHNEDGFRFKRITLLWADKVTGLLFIPLTGRCLSSEEVVMTEHPVEAKAKVRKAKYVAKPLSIREQVR